MNLEKRIAYMATLKHTDQAAFLTAIEPWLYGKRPLPRVIHRIIVSQKGDVSLMFSGGVSMIWGWRLQREMRGRQALLIPHEKNGRRSLIVASPDGTAWVKRFFDPGEHAFWARGRKKIPDLRIYTFILPSTRSLTVCGAECLFSGKWKPGKLISVHVSRGEIVAVSGFMMKHYALLRRIKATTGIEKIIIGTQLPRQTLLETITGTVPDIPAHKVTGNGSCVVFSKTRLFLTTDDEKALGLTENNMRVILHVDHGIPTAISNGNGVSISTIVVRGSNGRPITASRSRVESHTLPRIACIHRMNITTCQGDKFIRVAGKRFFIPRGIDLVPDTSIIVVLEARTRILYMSRHEELTDTERALILTLEHFSSADSTSQNQCDALQNIIRATVVVCKNGALDPIGVRWLYETLLKHTESASKPTSEKKNARGIRLQLIHRLRNLATSSRPSP